MYQSGLGVKRDYAAALKWLYISSDMGNAQAKTCIGFAYNFGTLNIDRDYASAFEWYNKAIELGEPNAKCFISSLYLEGKGTERNIEKGIEMLTESAEEGVVVAQKALAFKYLEGEYVVNDYHKAMEWFERASAQGDEESAEQLRILQNIIEERALFLSEHPDFPEGEDKIILIHPQ